MLFRPRLALILAVILFGCMFGDRTSRAEQRWDQPPGVYVVTGDGPVRLHTYGEQTRAYDTGSMVFHFQAGSLDRVPTASSIKSIVVDMLGWKPRSLHFVVGRDQLTADFPESRQLVFRQLLVSATAVDVYCREFSSPWVKEAYRSLSARYAGEPDLPEAFFIVILNSSAGLARRAYLVRLAPELVGGVDRVRFELEAGGW